MVPATEIKIGDKIRDMNVKQLTVASIEERTPENIAREKREAAARLLAEAEALAPAAK